MSFSGRRGDGKRRQNADETESTPLIGVPARNYNRRGGRASGQLAGSGRGGGSSYRGGSNARNNSLRDHHPGSQHSSDVANRSSDRDQDSVRDSWLRGAGVSDTILAATSNLKGAEYVQSKTALTDLFHKVDLVPEIQAELLLEEGAYADNVSVYGDYSDDAGHHTIQDALDEHANVCVLNDPNLRDPSGLTGLPASTNVNGSNYPPGSSTKQIFLPERRLSLEWRNLTFTVEKAGKILNNCYGKLHPGEVTALIGPSGAGKSTLMNLLAARQRWSGQGVQLTGEVRYGGKIVSYELLKQSISEAERRRNIEEMLESLDLLHVKHAKIGNALVKGISGGQRKRVAVGIELLTRPSIVFLDEPTSGLDSYSSLRLITMLKKFATEQNCIVAATIHQPSSELFSKFDRVITMRYGEVLFAGMVGARAENHLARCNLVEGIENNKAGGAGTSSAGTLGGNRTPELGGSAVADGITPSQPPTVDHFHRINMETNGSNPTSVTSKRAKRTLERLKAVSEFLERIIEKPCPPGYNLCDWLMILASGHLDDLEVREAIEQTARVYEMLNPGYGEKRQPLLPAFAKSESEDHGAGPGNETSLPPLRFGSGDHFHEGANNAGRKADRPHDGADGLQEDRDFGHEHSIDLEAGGGFSRQRHNLETLYHYGGATLGPVLEESPSGNGDHATPSFSPASNGSPLDASNSVLFSPRPSLLTPAPRLEPQITTNPDGSVTINPSSEIKCNKAQGVGPNCLKLLHMKFKRGQVELEAENQKALLDLVDVPPFCGQLGALTKRSFRGKLRDPFAAIVNRLLVPTITILAQGLVYVNCGRQLRSGIGPDGHPLVSESQWTGKLTEINNATCNILFSVFISSGFAQLTTLPQERAVFLREYTGRYYGVSAYLLSQLLADLPLLLATVLCLDGSYVCIGPYYMFGLNGNLLFHLYLNLVGAVAGAALGVLMSTLAPNSATIPVLYAPLILSTLPNAFSGIFRPLSQVPAWISWLSWVIPVAYTARASQWLEFGVVVPKTVENPGAEEFLGLDLPEEIREEIRKNWEKARDGFVNDRELTVDFLYYFPLAALGLALAYRFMGWGILKLNSQSVF
eukprot:g6856.t1